MKVRFLILTFVLFAIFLFGQTQNKPTNTVQQKRISENDIYQLFPTQNYWTLLN